MSESRSRSRANNLLPEEEVAGSSAPEAQAEAILADSDDRQAERDLVVDPEVEHRRSSETVMADESRL
jgi:hypothetical protein